VIRTNRSRFLAWVVPVLFLAKAGVLAARIIPLWDVIDETGHFAYARDLWSGGGLLRMVEAKVGSDIMSDLKQQPAAAIVNSAAHHPPLYHLLAGALWKAATLFTEDPHILFRAPRLVSPLLGALALFYIFKTIERIGLGPPTALAVSASVASVPRFAWQAGGTNHDIMMAALGAASTYYLVDFVMGRRLGSAWTSMMLMSFAAATKISGLVVLAPMAGVLALEMTVADGWARWAGKSVALVATALVLPGIWMFRNLVLYGDPFATIEDVTGSMVLNEATPRMGLAAYLRTFPVVEEFFESLIGHLGWAGRMDGPQSWLDVLPPYRTIFEIVTVVFASVALIWAARTLRLSMGRGAGEPEPQTALAALQARMPAALRAVLVGAAAMVTLSILVTAPPVFRAEQPSWLLVGAVSAILALGPIAVLALITPLDGPRRAVFYSLAVTVLFCVVLLEQSYSGYLMSGQTWRTVGRLFYVALGFMVLGFCVPALITLGRSAERVALSAAVVLCTAEAAFFLTSVVPHFAGSS